MGTEKSIVVSARTTPAMLYGRCVFIQSKPCGKNDEEEFEEVGGIKIFI